jgi:hypothetical protein
MYKLVILIEQDLEDPLFQQNWPQFLHQAESMPGLRKEASSHVEYVIFGAYPYTLIHELYFDSLEDLQASMSSPAGREAGKLIQTISQGKVTILTAGHTEDAAENLARYRKQSGDE